VRFRRLVVALEPLPERWRLLQEAVEAAGRMEAELIALFVENESLLDFAGLPFAREVGAFSAARREFDTGAMQRLLRAMAQEARRVLEVHAQRVSVRWSFRVVRGSLVQVLLAEAGEGDLVIAVCARPLASGGPRKARIVHVEDPEQALAALAPGGGLVLTSEDVTRLCETLRRLARGERRKGK
jgi:hypothetical protein